MFWKQGAAESFRENKKTKNKSKRNPSDRSDKLVGHGLQGRMESRQSFEPRGAVSKQVPRQRGLTGLETEMEGQTSDENHRTCQTKDTQPLVANSPQRTKD